ncbi:zinc-binding dehydrogenase [Herbiconiux sp. CPCC 203407]|uniref:Zinc-binding dehydrogenase n=1 Tax=Herbiconiux oxytropis TaxID=2970915 RepID=A0AA41XCC7_9MICO|nr:zinc-binding dehydrogenase [Herbiconiux oxytropis]MCS5723912.1 zinc-binding dehydrogenase [Herbiconiux oxytropis]MCS5725432.1 zinc-binding dehydrogenase [Herbiconiux oxytropis]
MRAAVLREFNAPFSIEEVTFLDAAPGRVLVRTGASPFCSTDVTNWRGELGKVPPAILGHASMGVVEDVGAGVEGIRVGQRVVVPGTPECGVCFFCSRGRPDQCSELFDRPGVSATSDGYLQVATGADGAAIKAAGLVGGYAEMMNVHATQVFPIDSDLPDEHIAMLGCGVTTGFGAVVNAARVAPGDTVAVVGLGHVGLWAVQAARLAGASTIIGIDPIASRRELAGQLGATHVLDPGVAARAVVLSLTGGHGADHVIEAAGPPEAVPEAFGYSRRAGTVVLMGVKKAGSTVTLSQAAVSVEGRTIIGVQNGNARMRRDLPLLVSLLESGRLVAEPIVTTRYPLEGMDAALAASRDHTDVCGLIVPALSGRGE